MGITDNLDVYRTVLNHVVRPDNAADRQDSPHVYLTAWEALFIRNELLDYAHYHARDNTEERIALAYEEYINMLVRDERKGAVCLYAHTRKAWTVMLDALRNSPDVEVAEWVNDKVSDAFLDAADEGLID